MKKFISGLIAGMLIATAGVASAEVIGNMIGKEVQGEATVDLKGTELQDKGVIIDGTTYVPIRELAEKQGLEVSYDAETNKVKLTDIVPVMDATPEWNKPKPTPPVEAPKPDPFVEQMKTMRMYPIKSNSIVLNARPEDPAYYVVLDGETYINANGNLRDYIKPGLVTTISLNDKTITFNVSPEPKYSPGIDVFLHYGNVMVKLSALGLKANIVDDILWIEKQ